MNGEERLTKIKELEKHIKDLQTMYSNFKSDFDKLEKNTFRKLTIAMNISTTLEAINDEISTCKEELEELKG